MNKKLIAFATGMLALVASAAVAGGPPSMWGTELIVPAAGRGPGNAGSFWVTDLWVRGTTGSVVTLEWHPADASDSSASAVANVTLSEPIAYFADVLQTKFGLSSGSGTIRLTSSSAIGATLRIYDSSSSGTYGLAMVAMPSSMGMDQSGMGGGMGGGSSDQHPTMAMMGLVPTPTARVNVRVSNFSGDRITGTLRVLDADGGLPASGDKTARFDIAGWSSHQFDDLLAGVTSRFPGGMGLQVQVEMDDSSMGRMMTVASVVDNRTNDSYALTGMGMGSMMTP